MLALDRYLQRERIKRTLPYIASHSKVLDIGSNKGELFHYYRQRNIPIRGIGIDPNIEGDRKENTFELIKDFFPSSKLRDDSFDAIVMLAVLEHIPKEQLGDLAKECFQRLKTGGKLVITVPSKRVDYILSALLFFRLISGMELEQHYGYDVEMTPKIFGDAGFRLVTHKTFQLGLNHLFVFQK